MLNLSSFFNTPSVACVLQCAAVCCSVLQCVAVRRMHVLQCAAVSTRRPPASRPLQRVAVCCSVISQDVHQRRVRHALCRLVCCSELQCVAAHRMYVLQQTWQDIHQQRHRHALKLHVPLHVHTNLTIT